MYTVLCAFEDRQLALRAITKMIRAGLPRDDIHLQPEADFYVDVEDEDNDSPGRIGLLAQLQTFGARLLRSGVPPGAEGTYRDAVRKGSPVVVVHVANAEQALATATRMADLGSFDVEHWRSEQKAFEEVR